MKTQTIYRVNLIRSQRAAERENLCLREEVNTDFLKEWSNWGKPSDHRKVNKAILNHFTTHNYTYIDDHCKTAKPFTVYNMDTIENMLGLAYTSSGDYAGLWVCNGIYVMATPTHHFTGFMINSLGEVVASVENENEDTIFIKL